MKISNAFQISERIENDGMDSWTIDIRYLAIIKSYYEGWEWPSALGVEVTVHLVKQVEPKGVYII